MKKTFFSILLLLLIFGAIEGGASLFFHLKQDRFTFADTSQYLLTDQDIERVSKSFNARLGWKTPFPTQFGQRPTDQHYDKNLIATFGDSYTFGDEVKDDETWQVFLAKMLGENVLNFGNGAYGVDQSFLRFREDFSKIKTPIVTLGLITENINRIVNTYRKFYSQTTGIPATKPRFHLQNGQLLLAKNPIQSEAELRFLKNTKFLRTIGHNDYWFNSSKRPYFAFPYSALFLNPGIRQEIINGKSGDLIHANSLSQRNPWQDPEIRELLFAILDRFVLEAKEQGAMPIITLMPLEFEVAQKIQTGVTPQEIEVILAHCKSKQHHVFCPLDTLVRAYLQNPEQVLFAPGGHYTAIANSAIAKSMQLQINKLVLNASRLQQPSTDQ